MAFKLPKDTRKYFDLIDRRTDGGVKFKTLFDKYYLCLMAGLYKGNIGVVEKIEKDRFIEYYPDLYEGVNELIMGLLIDAEMERRDIQRQDKRRIENLMLEIIDHNSVTKLSETGMELLNRYAVSGMELIRDNIPKTSELETFLIHYYNLLKPEEDILILQ
ncbi:hypothetical protein [Anaeromicrobium sediminis]|uniref:Uncharacterized protein n=1 Tax=Anaeromicrobium sediminis TaxID=1478221 RepID=A0A267MR12_9FIRM|nr:hypothetical protein [Anaeromicrobium sediminis]PAB61348.1 hypothetical protein CCE28_02660 [Anaeromicrobium sediminis]